jgi:hypothetical protein
MCHSSDQTISSVFKTITSESVYNQRIRRIDNDPFYAVLMNAEILLIDHLLINNIDETNHSKEVEIGISKMSCLLCLYYIDALNKKYDRCFCQSDSTNGKIDGKWTYRHNEDSSILNLINEKLIENIQQSIQKLCLTSGRAGSQKSGYSDIMSTSMENDEFDEEEYRRIRP